MSTDLILYARGLKYMRVFNILRVDLTLQAWVWYYVRKFNLIRVDLIIMSVDVGVNTSSITTPLDFVWRDIMIDWLIVSQFNGTSTPKGSYSAKTGDNDCNVIQVDTV